LQLKWLTATLDKIGSEKPVMLFMHHNPERPNPAATPPPKTNGLIDTSQLLDLVLPRRNVKALLTGHLHAWSHTRIEGLHLVGLPATSYTFDAKQPLGWVDCTVDEGGAKLTLRSILPDHDRNGERVDLRWRA
jgi:hypothetical protein